MSEKDEEIVTKVNHAGVEDKIVVTEEGEIEDTVSINEETTSNDEGSNFKDNSIHSPIDERNTKEKSSVVPDHIKTFRSRWGLTDQKTTSETNKRKNEETLEEDNNKKLRYDPYPYSNDPYHRAYFYNYYNYIQGYKYGYPVSNYQYELAQYSRNSYRNQGRR